MQHERGDVPGPSTAQTSPAPQGEPASEPTAVPQAPVGWETGSSSPDPAKSPDPIPGKFPVPSKGETKAGER